MTGSLSQRRATTERPDWIWHDVEALLRSEFGVSDDTYKGAAKDIYNLFLAQGWTPPSRSTCVICRLPVDTSRYGAVSHDGGWAHDVCVRHAEATTDISA